jgi:hypothetical protein
MYVYFNKIVNSRHPVEKRGPEQGHDASRPCRRILDAGVRRHDVQEALAEFLSALFFRYGENVPRGYFA